MKKLIILLMVFGMTTMAGATLQISVNGNPEPIDSDIDLTPSQHAILDIWTDAAIPVNAEFALLTYDAYGTISGGGYVGPTDGGNIMADFYDPASGMGVVVPSGMNGVAGWMMVSSGAGIPSGATLYDDIDFHCEAMGDAFVELWTIDLGSGGLLNLEDSVVIHQVPEPMTMALLGLGGLGLLRRRR